MSKTMKEERNTVERKKYIAATNLMKEAKEKVIEVEIESLMESLKLYRLCKSGEFVKVKHVTPQMLENTLGKFKECPDPTGTTADYVAETDKYKIIGSMYDATATIIVK